MRFKFDYVLGIAILCFVVLGILILASVSGVISQEKFGNTNYYLYHQIQYGILIGIILGIFLFFTPLDFLKKWAWAIVFVNIIFMILVFIPSLGIVAGGAPRWFNLGFTTFQPAEFFKFSFILYMASWLSNPMRNTSSDSRKKLIKEDHNLKYTLFPFLIILGVVAFLLGMQSDMSTLAVIAFIGLAMYFSAEAPFWHTAIISLIGISLAIFMIKVSSYRMMRLKVLLGLIEDPMGLGYQIKQILIAIGSGGIFGLGLGMSNQKYSFVPQIMSDSIFAIFAEETGFIGYLVLLTLILVILWRSFKIAKLSDDKFSKLFSIGFGSWICIQAFVNMGAMAGIIPLTGIPLPFMSYGGSHIIAELAGAGLLLNISRKLQK